MRAPRRTPAVSENVFPIFKSEKRPTSTRVGRSRGCENQVYITAREESEANLVPIRTSKLDLAPPVGAYFVEYLRQILDPKYGENALYQGGYTIYTYTLDLKMQRAAEDVMEKSLADFDKDRQERSSTAELKAAKKSKKLVIDRLDDDRQSAERRGLVALDPRTR